jgi:class 3 adenylate cyclase
MKGPLAHHDVVLRVAVEGHGGEVVKTTGDGVHAAFGRAEDAVAAGGRGSDGECSQGRRQSPQAQRAAHSLLRMSARATDVSVDPLSLRGSSLNDGGLLIPLLRHNR